MHRTRAWVVVAIVAVVGFVAAEALANQMIVYPAKGQSDQKMQKDKAECQQWATKQTGIDPVALASEPAQADTSATSGPKGGRLKGGGRGAAGGAAIGAIAGDAGKGAAIGAAAGAMRGGMEQRRERKEEKAEAQQASAQSHQQQMATFNRACAACLEGRGYTVK